MHSKPQGSTAGDGQKSGLARFCCLLKVESYFCIFLLINAGISNSSSSGS